MLGSSALLLCLSASILIATGPSEVADAVMQGDGAAVQKLVEQHADVNAPQADGATALHWAVFRSDKPTVDLLLRAGPTPRLLIATAPRHCGWRASTEMPRSSRRSWLPEPMRMNICRSEGLLSWWRRAPAMSMR